MLNLRGREETLLLGAATMRGIVEKLVPGVNIVTRPRMSLLTYSGSKKITRLPRRSAVVAFSADEVYAIAELIRRQRGGAAVVLGSLSPRTRNAQVELFQSGDVDFLVATDAIGMGLNLDVDHVAFASDRKFDGYQYRRLTRGRVRPDRRARRPAHPRRHVRRDQPRRPLRGRARSKRWRAIASSRSRPCSGAIATSISHSLDALRASLDRAAAPARA